MDIRNLQCKAVTYILLSLPFIKTRENLHKNVNENMFSFTFLCKFSCICNFAIFDWIFIKFSPKSKSKKLGMIYIILGSFCSLLNWEEADIQPQFRPRKIPVYDVISTKISYAGLFILLYLHNTSVFIDSINIYHQSSER